MSVVTLKPDNNSADAALCRVGDFQPKVAAGIYVVSVVEWRTYVYQGGCAKVEMFFVIVDGPDQDIIVSRHYNVRRLLEEPGPGGKVEVGQKQQLYRDFCLIDPDWPRLFEIDLGRMIGRKLRVRIETVAHDRDRKPIPGSAQYSVVREILDVIE